jgi:hypothetical protein
VVFVLGMLMVIWFLLAIPGTFFILGCAIYGCYLGARDGWQGQRPRHGRRVRGR